MRNHSLDLVLVVFVTLIVMVLPLQPLARAPFNLLLILYLPGSALTAAIFPAKSLVTPERFLYSIGLSLAITAISGLGLHLIGIGIRPGPLAAIIGCITLISALAAWIQRRRSSPVSRLPTMPRLYLSDSLFLLFSGLILASALAIARSPASPGGFDGYTLLWIEEAGGIPGKFQIGIESHEFLPADYQIKFLAGDQEIKTAPAFRLQPGEALEITYTLPSWIPPEGSLEVQLFQLENPREPYRRVLVWLTK